MTRIARLAVFGYPIVKAPLGAAYVTLAAKGQQARIRSVNTPAAAMAQIPASIGDYGVLRMHDVDGVSLEPGKPVVFKPGGYHVMLMDLKAWRKAGGTFPPTLMFRHTSPLTVTVIVQTRPVSSTAADRNRDGALA